MSSDDACLRVEWMRDEIVRVNGEKEKALRECLYQQAENDQLRSQLAATMNTRSETRQLKETNLMQEQKLQELEQQLTDIKLQLDDTQFALWSVPSPIQKLCARMLVPEKTKPLVKGKMRRSKGKENQETCPRSVVESMVSEDEVAQSPVLRLHLPLYR